MVEPLSNPLKGSLQVATTLVETSKSCFTVQLINLTNQGITLTCRTYHGTVQPVELTREQLALAVGGTLLFTYTAKSYFHRPTAELNSDNTLKRYLKECS